MMTKAELINLPIGTLVETATGSIYQEYREYYLVHETSTNSFAVGPFDSEIQARAFATVEMEWVECVIVPKSKVPQRLLRRVINPFTLIPK